MRKNLRAETILNVVKDVILQQLYYCENLI